MAYSTQTDLENRLSPATLAALTDDTNGTTTSSAIVTALIARADALIDAKIAADYTTPITSPPTIINAISVDLACFYAMQRRYTEQAMPPDWTQTYKNAIAILDDVASGKLTLAGVPTPSTDSSKEAEVIAPDRIVAFNDSTSPWSKF